MMDLITTKAGTSTASAVYYSRAEGCYYVDCFTHGELVHSLELVNLWDAISAAQNHTALS